MFCMSSVTGAARPRFVSVILICFLSAGQPIASAQSNLDPVVVTATRSPQASSRLASDISVIEAREFVNSVPGSIADVLRRQNGVQVVNNGGPAATTSVFIRGANSGQSLFLIEGFRIGAGTTGTPSPQTLNPLLFGGAEILRGPSSSVYGADAMGGAVNFLLPQGKGPWRGDVMVSQGSFRTTTLAANASGGGSDFGLAFGIADQRSDGYNATRTGNFSFNPDRDGFRRQSAQLNGFVTLAPGHTIGLVAYTDHLSSDFDSGLSFSNAETRSRAHLIGLTGTHQLSQDTALRLRLGQTTDFSQSISNFPGTFRTEQLQGSAQLDWQAMRGLQLSAGLERNDQSITSTSYGATAPGGRVTDSIRLGALWNQGAHSINAAARLDDDNQYGDRSTGSVGYAYRVNAAWRIAGQLSTGFKAPSFNDLYFPGFGRSSIRPESSKNAEVGVYYNASSGPNNTTQARFVLYRNRVEDLIVFVPVCPDPSPQFVFGCAENVNRAQLQGASLGLIQKFGNTRLSAALDWLDAKDVATDLVLPRRASRTLNLRADHQLGNVLLGAEVQASSASFENVANTQRLAGYALMHLHGNWQIDKQWSMFVRVNNLFDRHYETARFFVTPGFNATIGVRYAMQ